MKKLFTILAVATLLVAAPANAQLKFGLKGGLNINNVKLDKSIADADNQTGFFIGPMAEFTIPIVGVGAEVGLLYNNKSMKIGAAADQLIAGETTQKPACADWQLHILADGDKGLDRAKADV